LLAAEQAMLLVAVAVRVDISLYQEFQWLLEHLIQQMLAQVASTPLAIAVMLVTLEILVHLAAVHLWQLCPPAAAADVIIHRVVNQTAVVDQVVAALDGMVVQKHFMQVLTELSVKDTLVDLVYTITAHQQVHTTVVEAEAELEIEAMVELTDFNKVVVEREWLQT
jgi:hypothetical protein